MWVLCLGGREWGAGCSPTAPGRCLHFECRGAPARVPGVEMRGSPPLAPPLCVCGDVYLTLPYLTFVAFHIFFFFGASKAELGNLAFTTVKSSTYRKNVGGNAPSPHALADDTLATLAYVRLSSTTDVLRHYVRTVKTGTYIHASTTFPSNFLFGSLRSLRCARAGPRTPDAGGSWP